jgi:rod shape-determining protein MreD
MLQNIFIFIAILAAAAFQVSFLPYFFSSQNVPDFLLVIIIFSATRVDFWKILIWVILGGMILDFSYFVPLGTNIFAFILVAFIVNFLARKILAAQGPWKFLSIFCLIIIGTLINDWVLAIFNQIIARESFHYPASLFLGKDIFIRIFFNLIIFALVYWPLEKINKYFDLYYSRTKILK